MWMRSLRDIAVEQRRFGGIHHRPGSADEPGIDAVGIADQLIDRIIAISRSSMPLNRSTSPSSSLRKW